MITVNLYYTGTNDNGIILLETKNSVYEFSACEEAGRSHVTVTVHQ